MLFRVFLFISIEPQVATVDQVSVYLHCDSELSIFYFLHLHSLRLKRHTFLASAILRYKEDLTLTCFYQYALPLI